MPRRMSRVLNVLPAVVFALMLAAGTPAMALDGDPGSTARLVDCNERLEICRSTCGTTEPDVSYCYARCIENYGNCLSDPNDGSTSATRFLDGPLQQWQVMPATPQRLPGQGLQQN